MRCRIKVLAVKVLAILVAPLFVPTIAVAQTAEFAATVPGEVVHAGYALQDAWQNARNAASASQSIGAPRRPKAQHSALQEDSRRRHKR
jgi:hypothetical protein